MTIDDILRALSDLDNPGASITITAARVHVDLPGVSYLVHCDRVAGESPEQTIARDLVAHGELADIVARRDAAVVDAAARLASAQASAATARLHVEALMRAANGVTP